MKKAISFLTITSVMILALQLVGCAAKPVSHDQADTRNPATIGSGDVQVQFKFDKRDPGHISIPIKFKAGVTTVAQATEDALKASDRVQTFDLEKGFLKSITLKQDEKYGKSGKPYSTAKAGKKSFGWCVKVNGEFLMTGSDQRILKSDDEDIEWFYGEHKQVKGQFKCVPAKAISR